MPHNALNIETTVLTTVNAPYSEQLNEAALALCLKNPAAAIKKPSHVSSFFSDVSISGQKAFANKVGISNKALIKAAHEFAAWSGEQYPILS